jgi:hypothetical protein
MYVTIKDYSLFQSIYSIKIDLISKNDKLRNKTFYLKYKTHILEDNKTLYEYKIKNNDKLEVIFKSEGGTMAKGLLIFIWVIIFIWYFGFLFMGFMPYIAFIIPNILIKGLSTIVNFFYELTHPNNFMNSLLYFLKTYAIPFMNFIFEYFGLFIFIYLLTFFSVYHIYYYAKKEDACAAFNTTKILSLLTSFISIGLYFIANTASFMKFIASFIPEVIRQPFINLANTIADLRLSFIGIIPYIGQPQVNMVQGFAASIKGIAYLKLYGNQLLDNWDIAMELIKTDDARKFTKEQGIDEIINYIRLIEKAESHYANGKPITNKNKKNAEEMKSILPCFTPTASGYFLRSLFHNILKILIDMTFFIDICKVNGDYEATQQKLKEDFMKLIKLQKNENVKDSERERESKVKEKMEEFVEKIQNIKLDSIINIDCIINTVINGVTFSSLLAFIFLLLFVIFFFVKL